MPSYRYRNRRRYYRKRSVLSTRNIYANRSAKTQAYQIAALKRRINYVSRQCKPEVKVLTSDVIVDEFDSVMAYGKFAIGFPTQGTADNQRVGNSVNVKNCSFRLLLNKCLAGTDTNADNGFSYRAIMIQTVSPIDPASAIPSLTDLLALSATNSEALVSPFKDGITAKYRILRDVKGSTASNEKLLNIRYYPRRHEELDPSGFSRIIYIYVISSSSDRSVICMTASHRYVFTDA